MSVYPSPATYGQTQPLPPPLQVPTPQPVQWAPLPGGSQGPTGLEHLKSASTMNIHQEMNLEYNPTTGRLARAPNRYSVQNASGQQMYYVVEAQSEMLHNPDRLIELSVQDSTNRQCLMLRRPQFSNMCFCCNCCCEDTFSRMEVVGEVGDGGRPLGVVKQVHACCNARFLLLDTEGNQVMTIEGNGLQISTDYVLNVISVSGSTGSIHRSLGERRQAAVSLDHYVIQFPQDSDVIGKALMFAATFLIDYIYFDVHRKRRVRNNF